MARKSNPALPKAVTDMTKPKIVGTAAGVAVGAAASVPVANAIEDGVFTGILRAKPGFGLGLLYGIGALAAIATGAASAAKTKMPAASGAIGGGMIALSVPMVVRAIQNVRFGATPAPTPIASAEPPPVTAEGMAQFTGRGLPGLPMNGSLAPGPLPGQGRMNGSLAAGGLPGQMNGSIVRGQLPGSMLGARSNFGANFT